MRRLFFMFLAAVSLVACDKGGDDTPPKSITIANQQELTQTVYADDNAGKSGITFSTTGAWTSEISESATAKSTRAAADWISISPSRGDKAGDYTIQLSLLTNYTGEKRSASISLKCGSERIAIVVTQDAVTAAGDKPESDPEPSGEGLLTNETTGRSIKLVGATHTIGTNHVLINFDEDRSTGSDYTPSVSFANPLQDGKLRSGTYTNSRSYENNKCTWLKPSSVFFEPEEGTVKVERKGDVYTFTINMKSDKGNVITGSFTGVPKFVGQEVKVASITLSETSKTLEMGENLSLTATILPENATDKRYTWSSSNTAIATVSKEGWVESVSEGTTTITATSTEGAKTATCAVIVKAAVAVTGITVNPTELTLLEGERREFYDGTSVKVLPENAYNKEYTWKSSDESVATYSGKEIETKKEGETTITFTTKDGAKTATLKVKVNKRQGQGSGNAKVVDPNGKYDEVNYTLIEGIHTITAKNKVELSLKDDKGNGIVQLRFTNPLSNGRLATGNYTIYRSESPNNNSVINYSMYSDFGYYESGTVAVSVSGDTYTIAMTDIPTSNGRKITCSYTGKLTYVNEYIDVTSVTLDKNTLSLNLGKSAQLTASVNPTDAFNKKVIWSSSNTDIANVDQNGSVWTLGVGTATITVTTEDGAKTAACQVTVNALPSTGNGTFTNNHSQSLSIDRAEQWVNEKDTKEITIRLAKPNSAYDNLSFSLARGAGDTGVLKAGTYTSISHLASDELGVKYSYENTGSATVTLSGDNYIVTLDVTSSDGTKITGTYTGKIPKV